MDTLLIILGFVTASVLSGFSAYKDYWNKAKSAKTKYQRVILRVLFCIFCLSLLAAGVGIYQSYKAKKDADRQELIKKTQFDELFETNRVLAAELTDSKRLLKLSIEDERTTDVACNFLLEFDQEIASNIVQSAIVPEAKNNHFKVGDKIFLPFQEPKCVWEMGDAPIVEKTALYERTAKVKPHLRGSFDKIFAKDIVQSALLSALQGTQIRITFAHLISLETRQFEYQYVQANWAVRFTSEKMNDGGRSLFAHAQYNNDSVGLTISEIHACVSENESNNIGEVCWKFGDKLLVAVTVVLRPKKLDNDDLFSRLKQLNAPFDKVPDGHGAPNSMFEIYILPELMTDSRSTLFGTPAKVRWTKVVVMANHGSERLLESNNIEGPVFPPNSEAMGFYSTMGRLSLGSEEREY